ncbi:MAG: GNAT family N-acetyltransferase [Desulfomicrobium escambiense]|nr:GNAT family N-acetyltransferase [Desulfomicrobium escambiense]
MAVVRHQDRVTGIAPLMVSGDTVRLVGCSDLTDYGDFIVAPGQGPRFFRTLLEHLRSEGFRRLDTGRMRADAPTIGELEAQACRAGMDVCCERADVLYEMALPATWDDYLSFLSGKERHEVRRKPRRLHRAGEISLRVVEDRNDVPDAIASFMELFRMNTPEKVRFMTARKETFFRRLAGEMARAGLLKLFFSIWRALRWLRRCALITAPPYIFTTTDTTAVSAISAWDSSARSTAYAKASASAGSPSISSGERNPTNNDSAALLWSSCDAMSS